MKKKLSIKDLYHVAWKKLRIGFIDWLFLFGIQLLVVVGFTMCCGIMMLIAHYLFASYSKAVTVAMISIGSVFSSLITTVYPIMHDQNGLDAIFGRKMVGFDVNNRFFSYGVAKIIYWTLVLSAGMFFFIPGLFLAQRWRFVGLHLLDHGGTIFDAFRASWRITRGYVWFFAGISFIQMFTLVCCGPTIIGLVIIVPLNSLVNAGMYKQLHMEYDKDLALCSCEA